MFATVSRVNLRFCSSPLTYQTRSNSTEKLFDKILIANRGEIAVRVMKTCRRLGIKTVAVYSEADASSVHTRFADEAICIGPAPTKLSYLNMDNILEAVRKSGAQAVHPGYGFLSENSTFVGFLEKNNVTFIGPASESMDAMGDKIHSKALAKKLGVSTIPGFAGEVQNEDHMISIANEIGYPVMIKASAGGGGKGMRIAWNDKEAREALRLSKHEAANFFGDDRMLVEKFIEQPRHIEIQVLGDGQGNTVYLNERECSIQRRNQKVIEEAPSPFLDSKTRAAMGAQAVALANGVKYRSAGTVEMLVDAKRNFYFLEMNTRLQVEHPITELITKIDIVEEMIRIAAGQKLRYKQSDIRLEGWAVESRVYAEDPTRNFMPSIGRLYRYHAPDESHNVRCDTGIEDGSEISAFYDPLICKLATYGATRMEAIRHMRDALDRYVIMGVNHNVCFLRDVMENPKFLSGNLSTKFIAEEYPTGFKAHELTQLQEQQLVCSAATLYYNDRLRDRTINDQLPSFEDKMMDNVAETFVVSVNGKDFTVTVSSAEKDVALVQIEGKKAIRVANYPLQPNSPIFEASIEGERVILQRISSNYKGLILQFIGTKYEVNVMSKRQAELIKLMPVNSKKDKGNVLRSPMPGKVISLAVKEGQTVVAGQEIAVVEAMKMQNLLRSEKDGVVKKILVSQGNDVVVDQILIEYETPAAEESAEKK